MLGLKVESEEGSCEVTEVSKVEGEASINNRKGKLIFFYEWILKATWTGEWKFFPDTTNISPLVLNSAKKVV